MSKDLFKEKKFVPAEVLVVGVDIAKKTHYARCLSNGGEFATRKPFKFSNRRCGFEDFGRFISEMKSVANSKSVIVSMEPTGPYWKCLAEFLENKGIQVVLINPFHVKRSKEMYDNNQSKTDSKDALLIARLTLEGKYLNNIRLSDEEESLRHLTEYREKLVNKRTACINQIRSLLAEYFPEFEDVFSKIKGATAINILKVCPLPGDIVAMNVVELTALVKKTLKNKKAVKKVTELSGAAAKSIGKKKGQKGAGIALKSMAEELSSFESRLKQVEKQMEQILEKMKSFRILTSMSEIGVVTCASVISAVGDMNNFENADDVIKVMGLQLIEISSGQQKGEKHISKRGSSLPRAAIYRAVVRLCKKGRPFYDKYKQMRDSGKPPRVCFIALERKLIKIMFALIRDNSMYDSGYVEKKADKNLKQSRRKLAA